MEEVMACEYCDYCDSFVDLDTDVEHWEDEEYLKGRDKWKCAVELEDDYWSKAHERKDEKKYD